jgi:hypothetical protein
MRESKKERILTFLLAGIMAMMLASCSVSPGNTFGTGAEGAISKTTAVSIDNSKEVDDGSEIFEYTWIGYDYLPVTAKGEEATIQRMIEKKYNIRLKPVFVERSNYTELMNIKFASNEIPDVFTADNAVMLGQWVNQGVIAEIKKKDILAYAPDIAAELESMTSIDPNVTKYTIINGKNYGVQLINLDYMYRAPVIWRSDWLEKLGIEKIPETLDEFKDALYKISLSDPDRNGKKDTYGMNATGMDAIYGTSGFIPTSWGKKDGRIVWGGIQPEIRQVLALFQQWYKDGVIDPEFVTGENQGGYWAISQPFTNGRIGMTTMGSYYHWNPPYFPDQQWTSANGKLFKQIQGNDARYDFGKPAISADGKTGMYLWPIASGVTVCGAQMEENHKKMQRFLRSQNGFCEDEDYYINVRYGAEGVNWKYDNHHMIKILNDSKTPAEKTAVGQGGGFSFMNYNCAKWFKDIYKQQFEFADRVCADSRYTDACYGSLPSQSKFKSELDKLQNATYIGIITGSLSIDEFDRFVDKWMKQGGEQLTREANEWVMSIKSLEAE